MDLDLSLYDFPDVRRPWLRTNFVSTLDGAAYDSDGVTASLGGDTDSELFAHLRSIADVVLVGAGTARIEKYKPDSPTPMALVSRRLEIPEQLQRSGVTVVTTANAEAARVHALREAGVDVLMHGTGEIDWPSVLADFESRGWLKINCEGGPTLHGDLVAAGLVDDLCLTLAPVMTAGDAPRIAHGRQPVTHDMRLAHATHVDDVLFTRWVRADGS